MSSGHGVHGWLSFGSATALFCSFVLLPVSFAAEEPTALEEVVVTGFKQSIATAVEEKRKSAEIVDVIKADDIASFPDNNLAEAIQRIPGVSIERDSGQGRSITVRGMGEDFVRTRLNGMEALATTTGSTLGAGVNRSRGFDFSTFASELFNTIKVHKTQSAELDEGSLAATVDLFTARPFDYHGFHAALSTQGSYNDLGGTYQPRAAGLITDTWLDGRLGALFSAAYSKAHIVEDGYSDTSFSDFSDVNNGFCPPTPGKSVAYVNPIVGTGTYTPNCTPAAGPVPGSVPAAYNRLNQPNVFVVRNPGYGRFVNDQKRLGLTTSLQANPFGSTHITLDGVYSRFTQVRTDYALSNSALNRGNGAPVAGSGLSAAAATGRPNMKVLDDYVDPTGEMTYGVFDDTKVRSNLGFDDSTTTFWQSVLSVDQDLGQKGHAHLLVGKSDSLFDDPKQRLLAWDNLNADGFVYDARSNSKTPYINWGYDVANPANWSFVNGYSEIREFAQTVDNKYDTVQLDLKFELAQHLGLKFGASHKRYTFDSTSLRRQVPTLIPALPAGVTIADLSSLVTGFGKGLNLPAGSATSWVAPDLNKITSQFGIDCNCVNQYGDWRLTGITSSSIGDNRSVQENDNGGYIQFDFDMDVPLGMKLRGNIGTRFVRTNQAALGYLSATQPVNVERSYNDWLPALNLNLEVTPDVITRVGVSKGMSRPTLNFLSPGGTLTLTGTQPAANIGNPDVQPFRSNNYDLSVEWYPTHGSLLSAAFFYKAVKNYIQRLQVIEPYADTGLPVSLLGAGQDATTPFLVTTYLNSPGGFVKGIEINYQQAFTFLPAPFNRFGSLLNYTHVSSEITYYLSAAQHPAVLKAPFLNVSPDSVNATLFYEDRRFSARVSGAYRGKYLRAVPIRTGLPDTAGSFSTFNLDATVGYALTDHLSLRVDALNLTDQPADYWNGQTRQAQTVYSHTGRQYYFGAQFKY
jgi:iron complex outermembrane receptor protein